MPGSQWDQYKSAPAAGNSWDQYKAPSPAPAPTSGAIGAERVPPDAEPAGLQGPVTPEEANKSALFSGVKGIGKSLVDTARGIQSSNYALAPKDSPFRQPKPFASVNAEAQNPDEMAGKIAGNALQVALPIPSATDILPSAARSGAKLAELGKTLKGVPVRLTHTTPELEQAARISDAGGGPMGAAGNLMYRSHGMVPIDFPEGRLFQSNISNLSADEGQKMKPMLKGQIGKVAGAFRKDLSATADQALPAAETGYRGQPMSGGKFDYENAMDEYHHAKQIQGAGSTLVKKVLPAGGLLGAAYEGYKRLVK